MPWLVRDEVVLASLEVPTTRSGRARGLLGRDSFDGAIYLRPCRSVHTLRMRFPIDVAFVDAEMCVVRIVRLVPHRMTRPCWRARGVVEAPAGSFSSWGLHVGDQLEVEQ
jgi:uncharacterized membrane protein (UPF0127 family)